MEVDPQHNILVYTCMCVSFFGVWALIPYCVGWIIAEFWYTILVIHTYRYIELWTNGFIGLLAIVIAMWMITLIIILISVLVSKCCDCYYSTNTYERMVEI